MRLACRRFLMCLLGASGVTMLVGACTPTTGALGLGAASVAETETLSSEPPRTQSGSREEVNALISYYSDFYDVPEPLVRHVVNRESTFNPAARNGPYVGLMQIHPSTARTMGFDAAAENLADPATNLKYGVKYLRGAYIVAGEDFAGADRLYQSGYYYHAKRQGLLEETGLR